MASNFGIFEELTENSIFGLWKVKISANNPTFADQH